MDVNLYEVKIDRRRENSHHVYYFLAMAIDSLTVRECAMDDENDIAKVTIVLKNAASNANFIYRQASEPSAASIFFHTTKNY